MSHEWDINEYICIYVSMYICSLFIISVLVMSRNSCIRQYEYSVWFPTVNNLLFKNICYCSWNYRLFRKWENETNKPLLQWVFMITVLINYPFIHVMFSSFHFHVLFIHWHSPVLRKQLDENGQQSAVPWPIICSVFLSYITSYAQNSPTLQTMCVFTFTFQKIFLIFPGSSTHFLYVQTSHLWLSS